MVTDAQKKLLRQLNDGRMVVLKGSAYMVVGGEEDERIWPTTFYGLFDDGMVTQRADGAYVLSGYGRKVVDDL